MRNDVLMNKRQRAVLYSLLLSAGFIASPASVFAASESFPVTQSSLQNKVSISGTVRDAMGEPVIGASVVEKGTTNGTVTDLDGNFSLSVSSGATLEISFIGFKTQEIKVEPGKAINVTLKEDTEVLDEVVVVGFGTPVR